jgi:hypothetical protein
MLNYCVAPQISLQQHSAVLLELLLIAFVLLSLHLLEQRIFVLVLAVTLVLFSFVVVEKH